MAHYKPPRIGKGTPPHQDGYYFMLEPNEAVTMWMALEDVNEENGCVRYVKESHKMDAAYAKKLAEELAQSKKI